jgi:hypothetical protein
LARRGGLNFDLAKRVFDALLGRPAPAVPNLASNPGLRLIRVQDVVLASPVLCRVLAEPFTEVARFARRRRESVAADAENGCM